MKTQLLPGTDLRVSRICYGAGGFGSACKGADLAARINAYRDAGGNFLDTAHGYAFWVPEGAGCSERAIADYVRANGKGDLVIATKGGHPSAQGYRETADWLAPAQIAADVDDSLERLGLDTIDLYWLHRDDTRRPMADIIETLNVEIRRGRIRHLGASNWHWSRLQAAHDYAAAHGLKGFAASQPEWNLAEKNGATEHDPGPGTGTEMRRLSPADRDWHRRSGLPVIPYSASAGGYFASGGERAKGGYDNPVSRARLVRAQKLAKRLGATPGQVALAWLLAQPFPVFPIIGALDLQHLAEDLTAPELTLTTADAAWLENGG